MESRCGCCSTSTAKESCASLKSVVQTDDSSFRLRRLSGLRCTEIRYAQCSDNGSDVCLGVRGYRGRNGICRNYTVVVQFGGSFSPRPTYQDLVTAVTMDRDVQGRCILVCCAWRISLCLGLDRKHLGCEFWRAIPISLCGAGRTFFLAPFARAVDRADTRREMDSAYSEASGLVCQAPGEGYARSLHPSVNSIADERRRFIQLAGCSRSQVRLCQNRGRLLPCAAARTTAFRSSARKTM